VMVIEAGAFIVYRPPRVPRLASPQHPFRSSHESLFDCRSGRIAVETDKPPRTHRRGKIQPHVGDIPARATAQSSASDFDAYRGRRRMLE
jgi:hypothetical protein